MYNLVNFDGSIHSCNHHQNQDGEYFYSLLPPKPFCAPSSHKSNHSSVFSTVALPVLDLHINGIIYSVLFLGLASSM